MQNTAIIPSLCQLFKHSTISSTSSHVRQRRSDVVSHQYVFAKWFHYELDSVGWLFSSRMRHAVMVGYYGILVVEVGDLL